ncbi:MAG TPA: hypothetical protein PKY82_29470, partial [Pyrinomonadaceae bacterium]|nr:hypothetical protein [Pyrinomonadaceae bacterium]
SSPPQIIAGQPANSETKQDEIKLPTVNSVKEEIATTPEIKTTIKYVEVPIIKEKIVERIVYLNKPNQKKEIENINIKNPPTNAQNDNLASQFNLKDLQPVANVTYKIIRKGETNEK